MKAVAMLRTTGSSRDDDLDLNLNDLNLECFDETVADRSISRAVLGTAANFSPSGMLNFSLPNLKCNGWTFPDNYLLYYCLLFLLRSGYMYVNRLFSSRA